METHLEGDGWRCLWPVSCELGEGPVWDAARAVLWFVDIERPAVHRLDPATGARFSWTPPCRIGSIGLRRAGGLIAATERGFAVIDPGRDEFQVIGHPEASLPTNRFNDGKIDARGHFWAGSMDDRKKARTGALYRLDESRAWTMVDAEYGITNGPAFSPDGDTLYHTDTVDRITYAFDLAVDGSVSNKRVFVAWADGLGNPDGMTVDAAGYLWVAFWGGWCVRRISPGGEIVSEHPLPVGNVTSCAFGGSELDRLFVTTARQALDADAIEAQPLAGGLFEIMPGVRGMTGGVFAG